MDGTTEMLCPAQPNGEPAWAMLAGGARLDHPADDPRFRLMFGLVLLVCGYLFFRHRQAVGESTNYAIGGIPVTARTPGCIVGFFGVVLMLFGAFATVTSLWQILAG